MSFVKYIDNNSSFIRDLYQLIESNDRIIIGVDGRCGSGKTTFSDKLSSILDCTIFRMDDFFLPFEMKTKERLAKPGGNVHYERFQEEVLVPLLKGDPIIHRPYNCQLRSLDKPIYTEQNKVTIVEGVYTLHPTLQEVYDYKIFMTVDEDTQLARILKRNGAHKQQDFIKKWIPMEEFYFKMLQTEAQCDVCIDTSTFW